MENPEPRRKHRTSVDIELQSISESSTPLAAATPGGRLYTGVRMTTAGTRRTLILIVWVALICGVVVGSLLPEGSAVMAAVGRLHISDRVMHFCAYAALSLLPVIGFRERRKGIVAGLSMFLLGLLVEGAQHFFPGRAVELGDVIANGAGVSCGILLGREKGGGRIEKGE